MLMKMKPALIRLFTKRQNGVAFHGFVIAQRFYPVEGHPEAFEGAEPLIAQEGLCGTPTESGWYSATFSDGRKVHCKWSFPI